MNMGHDLRARDAADELGISIPTLYAYVSRGLIRSHAAADGSRERRYSAADVATLKERQAQRRDPARAAETALSWGTPVLESAITLIEQGRLYYRGHDALSLARTHHFEDVVRLLWTGHLDGNTEIPSNDNVADLEHTTLPAELRPLERMQAILPILANADATAYDLRSDAVRRAGGRILAAMTRQVAGREVEGLIADSLARHWAPEIAGASRLLDAALIVTADHELNPSSFTVRCVASTGAPLYDAIGAGIGAVRGFRHGAASYRIEALLSEIETPERVETVLEDRMRRGEPIPGFGHNLYPEGDPRATLLIDSCRQLQPDHPAVRLTEVLVDAATNLFRERPNVDLGLVTVCRLLGLEGGSAVNLMALGRTAGWVAHALEQYQTQRIIRPRARYVGPAPIVER